MGEGTTNKEDIVFSWHVNSKVVYREGEGERGDLGKRSRESKWIMIGSIKSAQPTKHSPVSPDHFTAYTSVTFLPSTRDPTATIKSLLSRRIVYSIYYRTTLVLP